MKKSTEISVCVFGSVARGSNDGVSDKDIMVLANNNKLAQPEIQKWASKGWSVAYYTYSRLESMVEARSIFIQHLKKEGIILEDNGSRLARILKKFEPKDCYEQDLESSKSLFIPAFREQQSLQGTQFIGDVLYTAIRNSALLTLANQDRYIFEYRDLMRAFSEVKKLNTNEIARLESLRAIKSDYRSRNKPNKDIFTVVLDALEIIRGALALDYRIVSSHSELRYLDIPYSNLREIEGKLLSYWPIQNLDTMQICDELSDIWKMVLNPRGYSWVTKSILPEEMYKLDTTLQFYGNCYGVRNLEKMDKTIAYSLKV